MNKYAHEYEERFAEILDTFQLEYEYEPRMFVIKKNGNGDVKKGFTPDFYLPELDTYVEITSMSGNGCNRKNRKVAETMELHGVNVVLLRKPKINKLFWRFRRGYLTREIVIDILSNNDTADASEQAGIRLPARTL